MPQQSALIIGASRGLGLGLAREYMRRDWQVTGTVRGGARTPLHELQADNLEIETVDITQPDQVAALRSRLSDRRFDLLFVNAGVANDPSETIGQITDETFMRIMMTNALSPLRVIEVLAPLVTPNGSIAAMSSGLGSVADNEGGGFELYRASKAALNTLMRSYAARSGASLGLFLIAPGWVRTDMGGPNAALDVETSIKGVVDTITNHAGQRGLRYLNYQGHTVRW